MKITIPYHTGHSFTARLALVVAAMAMFCIAPGAWAQGVVGDLLAGKLVAPKVGQWAWYDLNETPRASADSTAAPAAQHYTLRQAIVGAEQIGKDTAYWVEVEIIPEEGYCLLYKMLLTGPASNPRNVKRAYRKNGPLPVEEIAPAEGNADSPKRERRKSLGMEVVETKAGLLRAEHYILEEQGRTTDLWIDERVKPTGIVKMKNEEGEMALRSSGEGGKNAQTRLEIGNGSAADEGGSQPHGDDTDATKQ